MSQLRTIFDEIISKLKPLKTKHGDKVFKTIDLERGQMQRIKGFENTEEIISFPAIFFKPEEINNTPKPNNVYLTEMRIRVHVVTNELVRRDTLTIFDLPELVDRTLLDSKWDTVTMVSIRKGFEVMPETFDNTQIYELNYWVKYWNTNSYQYRDYIDANDINQNPDAPVDLFLDGYIDDDEPY